MKVKKGEIIVILDDHGIYAISEVAKDFDEDETFKLWDEWYQMEGDPENSSETRCIEKQVNWLIHNGYIEPERKYSELYW